MGHASSARHIEGMSTKHRMGLAISSSAIFPFPVGFIMCKLLIFKGKDCGSTQVSQQGRLRGKGKWCLETGRASRSS